MRNSPRFGLSGFSLQCLSCPAFSLGLSTGSDALIHGWLDLVPEPFVSLHGGDGCRLFFHNVPTPAPAGVDSRLFSGPIGQKKINSSCWGYREKCRMNRFFRGFNLGHCWSRIIDCILSFPFQFPHSTKIQSRYLMKTF